MTSAGPNTAAHPLRVILLSYWVTEESGGPGIAAAGFSEGLARLGAEVTLVAFDGPPGTWIIDKHSARARGFTLVKVPAGSFARRAAHMMSVLSRLLAVSNRPTVIWANGIWNAQSVVAGLAGLRWRVPYVIRPAGSLGHAAFARKRLKKWMYFTAVERHIVRRATGVHCMTDMEVAELPPDLRKKAFVAPSGVALANAAGVERDASLVGVLARLHPIKNHDKVLDAVEDLIRCGREVRMEFAGATSDEAYESRIRSRIGASPLLAPRVRLLGHVRRDRLAEVVARWRAAVLLSDQENFGHAVVTAAAMGVPSVVSPGVGLGPALVAAGAGIVAPHSGVAGALARLLDASAVELAACCQAFASQFGWDSCSRTLLRHLNAIAQPAVISPPSVSRDSGDAR